MIRTDFKTREILDSYFGLDGLDDALLEGLETVHIAGGDWLFRQGDAGDSFYFLIRGRLQVWVQSAEGDGSRLLGEVAPGETVGEISLLTGEKRSAGIRAIRDSMLVRVSRGAFEQLAEQHPQLVMRLAGRVASVLQQRTSKAPRGSRGLSTVAVLPLDGSEATLAFGRHLGDALDDFGSTLTVSADNLGQAGAPVASLDDAQEVPESLIKWLHDREDEHQFLIYQCASRATPWSRYAVRQSDIVILAASASGDSKPRAWETELDSEAAGSMVKRLLVLVHEDPSAPITDTAAWLSPRRVDYHAHVRSTSDDITRVARMISGNALGLVLAGGAARGFAHLGVFRALVELGVPVDWVGGTSIGAIMGATIVAYDWDWKEAIERSRNAFVGTRPFSDFTIPLMSLVAGKRSERLLHTHLDLEIEDLPTPFFCVSSRLDDGTMNLHESGSLAGALRATSSMPGIFPPAIIDGRLTIDGAVLDNMPVDIMQQKLVGRIIAVDLSSRKTYTVDYDSLPSPWAVLGGRIFPFARRHRVPSLMTTILKATEIGTLERMRELGERADLLLHPPVRKFGMTDVKSFDRIVQAGYDYTRSELAEWLEREGMSGPTNAGN